ncbi:MAG: FliI/YscN family ATPase [Sandaracinaceae bacterium]|nr:MAG: FliI/YscN family ATPase [Sandaracinaceae bacterium]
MAFDLERALSTLAATDSVAVTGRVRALVGLTIRASIPGVRVGEVVEILRRDQGPLLAEVVGFELDDATLLPLGDARGVGPDLPVRPTGRPFAIQASDALRGRVIDGLGQPIDGRPLPPGVAWPVMRPAPDPLSRARITTPFVTGVRAIDGLMTLGEGQRVGLFAGSGVGKSTLLGRIARKADADVVVIGMVGERGREVRELVEEGLGAEGLARSVVVAATSDAPALVRMRSAWVATALAEYYRDRGQRVLLLMDSVTRFARAAREVGLAAGEPPARRGYPPSVFAALPELLERTGQGERGSITAVYTVLVEGGDMDEPIADEVRGVLDGHVLLDRELAARGRWPAIDPLHSLSRVMDAVTDARQLEHARALRAHLSVYEAKRDLVLLGAHEPGRDPQLDAALERIDAIEAFLRQPRGETCSFDETVEALARAVR